jgi:hypothetical protein
MLDISRHQGCHRRCWCLVAVSETPVMRLQKYISVVSDDMIQVQKYSWTSAVSQPLLNVVSAVSKTERWCRISSIRYNARAFRFIYLVVSCHWRRWCFFSGVWDTSDMVSQISQMQSRKYVYQQCLRHANPGTKYAWKSAVSQTLLNVVSAVSQTALTQYPLCWRQGQSCQIYQAGRMWTQTPLLLLCGVWDTSTQHNISDIWDTP